MGGFSVHGLAPPHAFHELDRPGQMPNDSNERLTEELALSFRSLHAWAPFCEENGGRPRPEPATFTVARRCGSFRLAAPLARIVKMPRIRFYNRRSRYEHPQKHHFWRPLRWPWENPPAPESRILRTRRFRQAFVETPDHLAVIQPPTVARFDGARPALDRSAKPRLRLRAAAGGAAAALSADGQSC